jgi:hypothetical protein
VAIVAAFAFVTLSLASGLLYISELIEEHSRPAKVIGQRGIYVSGMPSFQAFSDACIIDNHCATLCVVPHRFLSIPTHPVLRLMSCCLPAKFLKFLAYDLFVLGLVYQLLRLGHCRPLPLVLVLLPRRAGISTLPSSLLIAPRTQFPRHRNVLWSLCVVGPAVPFPQPQRER